MGTGKTWRLRITDYYGKVVFERDGLWADSAKALSGNLGPKYPPTIFTHDISSPLEPKPTDFDPLDEPTNEEMDQRIYARERAIERTR